MRVPVAIVLRCLEPLLENEYVELPVPRHGYEDSPDDDPPDEMLVAESRSGPSVPGAAAGEFDEWPSIVPLIRAVENDSGSPHDRSGAFTFTPTGACAARQVIVRLERRLQASGLARLRPQWDRLRHELHVGSVLVKRFHRPADNQELVLHAFQEQSWPERIDDPLPGSRIDPRQRLHETIKSLNQGMLRSLIHFGGDGTGLGVRWCLCAARSRKRQRRNNSGR